MNKNRLTRKNISEIENNTGSIDDFLSRTKNGCENDICLNNYIKELKELTKKRKTVFKNMCEYLRKVDEDS